MSKYNCIDLFSGAGGLSLGFANTNRFNILAHIEWEKPMVTTLRNALIKRFKISEKETKKRVIKFDIQKTDELINGSWSDETLKIYGSDNDESVSQFGLNGVTNDKKIDVIFGGPPCQAYSLAGRAQDKHSMKYDYRNYLFESFVKIVDYYRPQCFVFENVPGMLSAKPGNQFVKDRIYEAFSKIGYEIKKPNEMKEIIYSSDDYEVPQTRKRVIVFGVRKDNKEWLFKFYQNLDNLKSKNPPPTVKDAIGHLPKFRPLKTPLKINNKNISHELIGTNNLTQNFPRYNNLRDLKAMKNSKIV
nr:DNA (cytosine-5-)-methyltransferase [Helicobacter pylori]